LKRDACPVFISLSLLLASIFYVNLVTPVRKKKEEKVLAAGVETF
jgi:hypothetical protein